MSASAWYVHAPATEAIRRRALSMLERARKDLRKMEDPEERREALHDFRVDLRRLRTYLRVFGAWMHGVGKGSRRRLRRWSRATGPARDAAVQLRWVETHLQGAATGEWAGIQWVASRLRLRREQGYARTQSRVGPSFEKHCPEVRSELARFTVKMRLDRPDPYDTLGAVLGAELPRLGRRLQSSLQRIRSLEDARRIHGARLEAKRLRYVAECLEDAAPEGYPETKAELKKLQDDLGALTDLSLIEETLESLRSRRRDGELHGPLLTLARWDVAQGMDRLDELVVEERKQRFDDLRQTWISGPRLQAVLGRLDTILESVLTREAARSPIGGKRRKSRLPG